MWSSRRDNLSIEVQNISHTVEGSTHRVSADVEGIPLWFESDDAALQAIPEVFSSTLLVRALRRQQDLYLASSISPLWRANADKLMAVYKEHWHFKPVQIYARDGMQQSRKTGDNYALCFSGGVDSFFTLLHSSYPLKYLVLVHGFDIPLQDTARFDATLSTIKAVASRSGKQVVVIRTNLREHPAKKDWEISYGASLAAIGHLLEDVGHMVISSSDPREEPVMVGSSWRTDSLWSSEALEIIHYGDEFTRAAKTGFIADNSIAQKYLRVCHANRNPSLNCGECEKCIRTMLMLQQLGRLSEFELFRGMSPKAKNIDAIPYLSQDKMATYEGFSLRPMPRDLAASVVSLMERSRKILPFTKYSRRIQRAAANFYNQQGLKRKIIGLYHGFVLKKRMLN